MPRIYIPLFSFMGWGGITLLALLNKLDFSLFWLTALGAVLAYFDIAMYDRTAEQYNRELEAAEPCDCNNCVNWRGECDNVPDDPGERDTEEDDGV